MTSRDGEYWRSGALPLIDSDAIGDIIAAASDISLVISDTGTILSISVNASHKSLGKLDHWVGRDIRETVTIESVPKLEAQIAALTADGPPLPPTELNHVDGGEWEFPALYSLRSIGSDGAILMMGRDLRPIAEMQQQLVKAQMALEHDYEAQRESDTRFRVLMEKASEAFFYLATSTGLITEANPAAAKLLGIAAGDLIGSHVAEVFDGRRKSELLSAISNAAVAESAEPLDLQARRSNRNIILSPYAFRAAGERMLLCKLVTEAGVVTPTNDISELATSLYVDGVDAIAFTDRDGLIKGANEAFLALIDAADQSQVTGRTLADFLVRGALDQRVMIENAMRTGHMRLFATKLSAAYGGETSVEISVTHLSDRAAPRLAFVIRDASRADALRSVNAAGGDDGAKSAMELVGSATLKEIVAETTDVVEKMCIETAVELTNNNRVAAAEMLGLSRQSLYVKLRKFGLLSRDGE
ncbi:MAG: transcriptional regulator PpsR [Pseudomonadota bacterium]